MASSGVGVILPQLTANNFNNWKFRVKALLEERQVQEVLQMIPTELTDEKRREFESKDARAKSIIIQCITDKHLDLVKDAKTAKEMMDALEGVFERKSVFTKLTLRRKLLTLKCNKNEKLEDHFLKFDGVVRELESSAVLTHRPVGHLLGGPRA